MFSMLRAANVRNTNPTANLFPATFKSILISNFSSTHSLGANCQKDDTDGALDSLRNLLTGETQAIKHRSTNKTSVNEEKLQEIYKSIRGKSSYVTTISYTYIAGYVAKKILKKVKHCNECKNSLLDYRKDNKDFDLIKAREHDKTSRLKYPKKEFNCAVRRAGHLVSQLLPHIAHMDGVSKYIRKTIKRKELFEWMQCIAHGKVVKRIFSILIFKTIMHSWLKTLNRILYGKEMRPSVLSRLDKVSKMVYLFYKKHRKYKKK